MLIRSVGMLTFTDNFVSTWMNYNLVIWFSGHLWTISYEEQFYLIIPWVLGKLYQLKKIITATVLASVMLIGMLIRAIYIHYNVKHPDIWVLPFTHFEAILGGYGLDLDYSINNQGKFLESFYCLAGYSHFLQ